MAEDPKALVEKNRKLILMRQGQAVEETTEQLLERNRRLVNMAEKAKKSQELLEALPQGHGSGLDADMVDGFHANELIGKGRSGGGGGSGGGMAEHGNEFHIPDFATQADLDILSQDFFGIMLPPEGKTITKTEYTWNADETLATLKAYDGVTLLFTLAYSWNEDKTLKEIVRTDA
jgi:hypothetical protein